MQTDADERDANAVPDDEHGTRRRDAGADARPCGQCGEGVRADGDERAEHDEPELRVASYGAQHPQLIGCDAGPVVVVVMDGYGLSKTDAGSAIAAAKKPTLDTLFAQHPNIRLRAHGTAVGMPSDEDMGNSEVGHLNIGAGRVVMQDLPRISEAIANREIERAPALLGLIERLRQSGGICHLIGLVSPGGVHSHQDHAAALAKILARARVPTVVHAFTDGRDTPPRSAGEDIACLTAALPPSVPIATVCGRYYAMDRDKRWERVAKAYDAIVAAQGPRFPDAHAVIADAYAHDVSDEFVVPAVVGNYQGMRDRDGVLCFNFRADRVREIFGALLDPA